MLKKLQFLFVFLVFATVCFAQPKIDEGFETSDSINLPTGWTKWNNANFVIDSMTNWTVRSVGDTLPGVGNLCVVHTGMKSCGASWWVGYDTSGILGTGDVWLVSKKVENITANDVLKFWMTGGSGTWDDSLQVWLSLIDNTPSGFLNTNIKIMDKYWPKDTGYQYGTWSDTSFSLAPYTGTDSMWIGFRYNMDLTNAGYFVTIDDVFLGDPSSIQQIGNNIPDKFALSQNYPNPFNPSTTIKFDLAKNTGVSLIVYNSLGQEVSRIFEGYTQAGSYEATFDASKLSSGTYYYRLTTDSFVETKKMLLIK